MINIVVGFTLLQFGLIKALPISDYAYNAPTGSGSFNGLSLSPLGSNGNGVGLGPSNSLGAGAFEAPLISKHFYLHSAPEEDESPPKRFVLGRPQRNYRVVFIKSPTSNKPRLSAEFAPNEDKTVIYVLAQKEPELDPSDIATPAPTEPSKPEVFFIKYKTPEEAVHAQQQIQAQYDALGGSSQVSDEGYAPLSSVVGSLGPAPSSSSSGPSSLSPSRLLAGVNNRYLPSTKK